MKHYTDVKKIEVVTTYLALGKAPLVEAVTGVPRQTIRAWKQQPWWKDLVDEIQTEDDAELDSKLTKIIDRSLDAVVDRIDHGDFLLDSRTGTIKRVPVKLRDVHKVSSELIDKRNLIRGKPTSITQKVTIEDMMGKLADEFKKWAKLMRPDERVIENETGACEAIEGEFDAIHEGREEGLREGIREISGEAGTNQEPGREKQSPQNGGSLSPR